jgi:pimeloyl-ACP methyl ester carboxylesterase
MRFQGKILSLLNISRLLQIDKDGLRYTADPMRNPSLLALQVLALLLAVAGRAQAALPGETPCRLLQGSLPAAFGQCGMLTVPLDYDDPDSATLELFVARIPAQTAEPLPDPLVLINGGPGGSAVDLYLQTRAAFEAVRRERDILLLDQRGTGRSLLGLDCALGEDFALETAMPEEIRAAVATCIAAFPNDPRFFTTSVAVRDLERLRETLGIESWNIYGVSYGTRVGQHYLRRYGERVRTLVLDGVVPAELPLGPAIARDAQRALDAIFARCAASAPCARRFANLPGQFAALRARFAGQSIEVVVNDPRSGAPESIALGEGDLLGVVRLMSYNDATAALLPLIVEQAYLGNFGPLAAQAELQIDALAESLGFAMHNSVVCTEDAPWFPDDLGPDATLPYLGTMVVDGLRAICEAWPRGVIDEDFHAPVVSDRPVLLLSGELDPVTPPANAERALASGLSNARHVIGRAQGHGLASVGCVPELINDLIETADPAALDVACLEREPPMPFFLSFQGPSP